MMEETCLMEHIKEQACYISTDLKADLLVSRSHRSPTRREYVLPDGLNSTTGFLRIPLDADARARQQASHEQARPVTFAVCQPKVAAPFNHRWTASSRAGMHMSLEGRLK